MWVLSVFLQLVTLSLGANLSRLNITRCFSLSWYTVLVSIDVS